jgi:hypothetical protein
MSQVIDLCEDSDDNAEYFHFPERPRIRRNRSIMLVSAMRMLPENKTARVSATFVDLERRTKVTFRHIKRRGVVRISERSTKNDAEGLQIQKKLTLPVGSEGAQV